MFENMMKHEKTWSEFCEWLEKDHGFYEGSDEDGDFSFKFMDYLLEDKTILSLLPFFFDEKGINIVPTKSDATTSYSDFPYTIWYFNEKNRIESLIKACEKAFEILKEQLK